MFDIDFFKKLNDTFGHLAGDFVLQKIGMLVQKTVRTHDIFARYGGEEFVILMRETTCQNAVNLAERIRRIIESYEFIFENKKIPVAISCGIATITEEMKNYQDLIGQADKYLYQSKNAGRNRVAGPCKPQV